MSPEERFQSRIIIEPSSGCWLWQGALNSDGYGTLRVSGRRMRAHRFAYESFVGPIGEGLTIDHLCRVRNCVNPGHLEPVTCRENLMRGETHAAANAAKTTCPRGHLFDMSIGGRRMCRTCRRESWRQYRRRVRAA